MRTTAITAIFLMIVCFILGSIHMRNQKMSLLHDTTPIFPSTELTMTYISFLRANETAFQEVMFQSEEEEDQSESKSSVDLLASNLDYTVAKHNGKIRYLGRCLSVMITSQQFDSNSCDFIVISIWSTANEFESFRSNTKDLWQVHQAQIYKNSASTNILSSLGFHGILPTAMNLYSKITGFKYDLDTKPSAATLQEASADGDERHFQVEKSESIANEILGRSNNDGDNKSQNTDKEPVYVFNWANSKSMKKEDQQKNIEYIWNFIPMLTLHNGGPIHIGSLETPGNQEVDGKYAEFAAVYYPSRNFFAKIVSSAWLFDIFENKRAGDDSLAVATTPYYVNKPSSFSTSCTSTF